VDMTSRPSRSCRGTLWLMLVLVLLPLLVLVGARLGHSDYLNCFTLSSSPRGIVSSDKAKAKAKANAKADRHHEHTR
jgi:hypothetical protein